MRRGHWIGLSTLMGSAVAAAGLARAYQRDMDEIRRLLEAASQLAETRVGPVEYARYGEGLAALVVHGAGGGFDQGLMVGRELLGEDFEIVAPSRFGYLRTPVPSRHSPAVQADAHAGLLDQLGLDRAVVIGVSAGAPSAIELALRHPERVSALILAVPRTWSPHDEVAVEDSPQSRLVLRSVLAGADFAFWLASKLARPSVVRFLGVPPAVDAQASEAERRRVAEIIRSILPLSRRVGGIQVDSKHAIGPWPLERIAAPTLVISATDDLFNTLPGARYTAERIPEAELVVLPSGGHLMVSRGDEVRAAIAAFLNRRLPAAKARSKQRSSAGPGGSSGRSQRRSDARSALFSTAPESAAGR